VNWSRDLKQDAIRGRVAEFKQSKLRQSLYRPFTKRWLFFDRILNEEVYQWPTIRGRVIVISDIGWRAPIFSALMTDTVADLHLCAAIDAHQCFPFSHLKDSAVAQFRLHYSQDSISKEDVFHYIYALLHHPQYRERYAANLKQELPRIPNAPDFTAFARAGKELARLHVEYESLKPWPLEYIENKDVPYAERVTKMKLSADRQSIAVNESLTLAGIPSEAFQYQLGSRSALEWVVDQYQVKDESDPNRDDDPTYIVRLLGQVVRVSVSTVQITTILPALSVTA
jgi:predicted helicase